MPGERDALVAKSEKLALEVQFIPGLAIEAKVLCARVAEMEVVAKRACTKHAKNKVWNERTKRAKNKVWNERGGSQFLECCNNVLDFPYSL